MSQIKLYRVSVVIAVFNEADNIISLTERLVASLNGNYAYDIIYSIAGTDGTYEKIKKYVEDKGYLNFRCIYSEKPNGLGNDFKKGFELIKPDVDYVLTMDADLNHQPEEIHRLFLMGENKDIVIGSRFVHGGTTQGIPISKIFVSKLGNFVYGLLFGNKIKDKSSGFRLYKRDALNEILEYKSSGFEFLMEIYLIAQRKGLSMKEVPINFIYRTKGESKFRFFKVGWAYFKLLWRKNE